MMTIGVLGLTIGAFRSDHFTTQKTPSSTEKGLEIMAPQSWLKWLMTCYAFKVDHFILPSGEQT